MTLTEKLLARAAGKASVQAGDNVWVKADVLMTHDVCGPGTIGVFRRDPRTGKLTSAQALADAQEGADGLISVRGVAVSSVGGFTATRRPPLPHFSTTAR